MFRQRFSGELSACPYGWMHRLTKSSRRLPNRSFQQRPQAVVSEERFRERAPIRTGVAPHRNHFSDHGDGNLFGHNRANLEAHWREDTLEEVPGNTFFLKLLDHSDHLALAPDHRDIASGRFDGPAQDAHVVAMAACDDHEVTRAVYRKLWEHTLILFGVDLVG